MSRRVVVDSSPLIILFKARLEEMLPKLFDEVIIPDAVMREVEAGPPDDLARTRLPNTLWANIEVPFAVQRSIGLGLGENSVIETAARHPVSQCVLDDAAARKHARAAGLSVIGTGGLLVLAARAGEIGSFDEAIAAVIGAGLWIDSTTVELLRSKVSG